MKFKQGGVEFKPLRTICYGALTVCLLSSAVIAEPLESASAQLLTKNEYRTDIEEIVVVGKKLKWREPEQEQEEWRPQRFELSKNIDPPRMQWLPEYNKDERDQYDHIRDRKGEKAEIKLFEWKF